MLQERPLSYHRALQSCDRGELVRAKKTAGNLRIIGGMWRGRRVPVVELPGLRPTTDRIRETLFNWLATELAGARCLDLFAGTGVLGLEALSRGAASCHFVEQQHSAATALSQLLHVLEAGDRASVLQRDALDLLGENSKRMPREHQQDATASGSRGMRSSAEEAQLLQTTGSKPGYDLLFLDPPFADSLLTRTMQLLDESQLLAENALIYVEYPVQQEPDFPGRWRPWRSKRSSAVVYELYRRESAV